MSGPLSGQQARTDSLELSGPAVSRTVEFAAEIQKSQTGSGCKSEASTKQDPWVRFVASGRLRLRRRTEESSAGQYGVDCLYQLLSGLRFQNISLRSSLADFRVQPPGMMRGED